MNAGTFTGQATLPPPGIRDLDFEGLALACPIDADGIRNRWLNPFIPAPGQKAKSYDLTISTYLHRMMKAYASIAVHGRGIPPFVHRLQVDPLRACLETVQKAAEGQATIESLKCMMEHVFGRRYDLDIPAALAAFQTHLIYTLVLYFWFEDNAGPWMNQSMIELQELASIVAKQGVVCRAEQQHKRPRWEEWIIAEAKRRTLYTMYLLDGMLSARDGLPSFLGTELEGLYAPACQSLWGSTSRQEWETMYDSFLDEWPEGYLAIDELWPAPEDFDDAAVMRRRHRVDHWLEDIDKFGTMLYAVTSYIHKN